MPAAKGSASTPLGPTMHKIGKDSVRKLIYPQITIHKKQKTLQKSQVGEAILTLLKNLFVPELKALTNMK